MKKSFRTLQPMRMRSLVAAAALGLLLQGCAYREIPLQTPVSPEGQALAAMERSRARSAEPNLEEQGRIAMERSLARAAFGAAQVREAAPVPSPPPNALAARPAPAAVPPAPVAAPVAAPVPVSSPVRAPAVPPAAPADAPVALAAQAQAERELSAAVDAWRQAWEAGDTNTYLRFYAPFFKGDAPTRADWERQRRARLSNGRIGLRLGDRQQVIRGNEAEVRFVQHYVSARHSDTGDKQMQWRNESGQWLIVAEQWRPR